MVEPISTPDGDLPLSDDMLDAIEQQERQPRLTLVEPGAKLESGEVTVEGTGGLNVSLTPETVEAVHGHLEELSALPPDGVDLDEQ